MESIVYLDLTRKTASETLGGSTLNWPTFTYGEDITLGVRLTQRQDGGTVEVEREIVELRASIGRVDARPDSGQWGFRIVGSIDDETTADMSHDISASDLKDVIEATGITVHSVEKKSGSYLVKFTGDTTTSFPAGSDFTITPNSTNTLNPVSFIRDRVHQSGGRWVHEIRLIQAPVASTDQSALVLPPPPSITEIQAGGIDGTTTWNEVQSLKIPASFRGTYQIKRGFARTRILDTSDGAEEIQEALDALRDEGGKFTVTNPTDNTAHIEFGGDMGGIDQDLMEVVVFDAPAGDRTFTLDLSHPELAALLRSEPEVTLFMEIEADIEDVDDPLTVRTRTLYFGQVKIRRELHWEELSTAANIDWLRPPLDARYSPFSLSQVSNGQLHYSLTVGDGVASVFVVDHNLDVTNVNVIVRENSTGGDLLVNGTDYSVVLSNDNSATITALGGPVASGDWIITVLGLEQTSYFDPHTHTIADIDGLQTILDDLGTRVSDIETLSGGDPIATDVADSGGMVAQWILPDIFEVYPSRETVKDSGPLTKLDVSGVRARGLLPAIHDTTLVNLSTILVGGELPAASAHTGAVFMNNTGGDFLVPGGQGHRSRTVLNLGWIASDGRMWYEVVRYDELEDSYYPAAFERNLFELHVNSKQLRLRKSFEVNLSIELAVLNADTRAYWHLAIEQGYYLDHQSPASLGPNLQSISWDTADPWISHPIIVMPTSTVHKFGVRVNRELVSAVDTLTPKARLYGALEGGLTPPSTANFAVRGRLIRFDVDDGVVNQSGLVAIRGLSLEGAADEDDAALAPTGTAIII